MSAASVILRVAAIAVAMCLLSRVDCLADDAATLDAWQSTFNDVWQADSCAQEFQSWKKYWGAVHTFYFGGTGFTGWFAESQALLAQVSDPGAAASVGAQLALLGRRIGGEWAKDDGCRKVRTRDTVIQRLGEPGKPALLNWENQLDKAAKATSGNAASIEAAIKAINGQLDALGVAPVSS